MKRNLVIMLVMIGLVCTGNVFGESITVIMPRHEMDLVGLWE